MSQLRVVVSGGYMKLQLMVSAETPLKVGIARQANVQAVKKCHNLLIVR